MELIVGIKLGPGSWLRLDEERIDGLEAALGCLIPDPIPPLVTVAMLPALTRDLSLPLPVPTSVINYGLDRVSAPNDLRKGGQIRAEVEVVQMEWVKEAVQLQLRRLIKVEGQSQGVVLVAEAISRFNFATTD